MISVFSGSGAAVAGVFVVWAQAPFRGLKAAAAHPAIKPRAARRLIITKGWILIVIVMAGSDGI
ncbi:hypothetical protein WG926_08805 [Tistrella sp. BH-R2-4]|uniref:Uncharacterized protein n=1 Tax=Tistrella arctica TaxID=3133430 RepID=A0ABU9YHX4_9PROT